MSQRAYVAGRLSLRTAQVLRSLRAQAQAYDVDLARAAGVSGQTIGRMLKGQAPLTLDVLDVLAKELGSSAEEVLRAAAAPDGTIVHLAVPPAQPPEGARVRRRRAASSDAPHAENKPSNPG